MTDQRVDKSDNETMTTSSSSSSEVKVGGFKTYLDPVFVNTTPHIIHLFEGGNHRDYTAARVEFPVDKKYQTRCNEKRTSHSFVDRSGVVTPIERTEYGAIIGLPEPADNQLCIVSSIILAANKELPPEMRRTDLVAPDMGKTCIRDPKGQVWACTGWVVL